MCRQIEANYRRIWFKCVSLQPAIKFCKLFDVGVDTARRRRFMNVVLNPEVHSFVSTLELRCSRTELLLGEDMTNND